MISEALEAVRKFHERLGHPTPSHPTPIDRERLDEVICWMREEIDELEALSVYMAGQLDAIADLIYFAFGLFIEMGVDGSKIFQFVHEANMRKLGDSIEYHPDGKIKKPVNWLPPESEISLYLSSQMEKE